MKSVPIQSSNNSVGQMFDRIANVYDKLNHILSFGMDFIWRSRLAGMVDKNRELKILDLATGTGDLLITLLQKNPNIKEALGLDISENMLAICKKKLSEKKLSEKTKLICSDVYFNSLPDNTYDIVSMGFGIRNTPDVSKTLSEIVRLLKKDGTALILEFSIPSNKVIRFFYMIYLRLWVPFIGRFVSGDRHAYSYLNTSIEGFYNTKDFSSIMRKSGFETVTAVSMACGIVSIYKGTR